MKKEEAKFCPSQVFEGMTSISAVINSYKAGVSDRRIEKILIDRKKRDSKKKEISYLKKESESGGFSIEYVDSAAISEITVGSSHGGIVALCTERHIPALSRGILPRDGFYVMAEGIEDPYNFGYAVRSIYAAGANGIVLPPRNWMTAAGVIARASAGASELTECFISEPEEAVQIFRDMGYKITAAGIRDSVPAFEADMTSPIFLLIGGEKRGLSRKVLDMCDSIVRLDYGRRFNGSLSAASAASVLAYEVFRQNKYIKEKI